MDLKRVAGKGGMPMVNRATARTLVEPPTLGFTAP
jgi:hypothetical protein